jgi:hypothetical protein
LLGKDGLLVELVIQRVSKEVTAGGEVCCARDSTVANNGVLRWRCWCQGQAGGCDGHRACSIGVDHYRVMGGQRQQHLVFEDSNVCVGQDLKGKRIGACATSTAGRVDCTSGYVTNWHWHDISPVLIVLL